MSQDTFLTGLLIQDQVRRKSSKVDEKPKTIPNLKMPAISQTQRDFSKQNSARAGFTAQIVQNLKPAIKQRSQSVAKIGAQREKLPKPSQTSQGFNNPLLKKIDQVNLYYEQVKTRKEIGDASRTQQQAILALKMKRGRQNSAPALKPFSFADAYDSAIQKDMSDLYQSKKGFFGTDDFKNIPKRQFFNEEVQKEEKRSQQQKKTYNQIMFEIQSKEKTLHGLRVKLGDIMNSFENNEDLRRQREYRVKQLFQVMKDYEVSDYTNEQYQNMYLRAKHDLKVFRKKAETAKRNAEFAKVMINNHNRGLAYTDFMIRKSIGEIHELKEFKDKGGDNINPEFEKHLFDEVSRFEDRRKLKEIKRHETKYELDQEDRRKRQLEKEAIEREERQKAQEEKRLNDLKKWKIKLHEYRERFRHFQKVTTVSHINELVPRLTELLQDYGDMISHMDNEISYQEEENDRLKDQVLEVYDIQNEEKFQKTTALNSINEIQEKKEKQDIQRLETILLEKNDQNQKLESESTKTDSVIVNACTSISRIMHQLNKGKPLQEAVNSENSTKVLSICGLKLERMLTMVLKKKKNFFMESINTDATIKEGSENYPPPYMGINYKNAVKQVKEETTQFDEDEEEEFEQFIRHIVQHGGGRNQLKEVWGEEPSEPAESQKEGLITDREALEKDQGAQNDDDEFSPRKSIGGTLIANGN